MPLAWTKLLLMLPLGAFLLCIAGSSASDSCGDSLHTRFGPPASSGMQHSSSNQVEGNRQVSNFALLNQVIQHQDSADAQHVRQVLTSDRSSIPPCSGPGCQSDPHRLPIPTAPLPVEVTIPFKAVAANACLKANADLQYTLRGTDCGDALAAHRCRIERPPQSIGSTVGFANSIV